MANKSKFQRVVADVQKSAISSIIQELSLPKWAGCRLAFETFAIGLTNQIICAINSKNSERLVFRVFGTDTELIIDRYIFIYKIYIVFAFVKFVFAIIYLYFGFREIFS